MPYITGQEKSFLLGDQPRTPGELTYVLTKICTEYMTQSGPKASYALYSSVVGALECAKLEFYRRALAPYEDKKCAENGDVYGT